MRDFLYGAPPAWPEPCAFGGPPKPSPPPPPQPMPDLLDPAVLAARRQRLLGAVTRSGRSSTYLADEYANDKLGTR